MPEIIIFFEREERVKMIKPVDQKYVADVAPLRVQ